MPVVQDTMNMIDKILSSDKQINMVEMVENLTKDAEDKEVMKELMCYFLLGCLKKKLSSNIREDIVNSVVNDISDPKDAKEKAEAIQEFIYNKEDFVETLKKLKNVIDNSNNYTNDNVFEKECNDINELIKHKQYIKALDSIYKFYPQIKTLVENDSINKTTAVSLDNTINQLADFSYIKKVKA